MRAYKRNIKKILFIFVVYFIAAQNAFSYVIPKNDTDSYFAYLLTQIKVEEKEREELDKINFVPKRQRNESALSFGLESSFAQIDLYSSFIDESKKEINDYKTIAAKVSFLSRRKRGYFLSFSLSFGTLIDSISSAGELVGLSKGFCFAGLEALFLGYDFRFDKFDIGIGLGIGAKYLFGHSEALQNNTTVLTLDIIAQPSIRYAINDYWGIMGGCDIGYNIMNSINLFSVDDTASCTTNPKIFYTPFICGCYSFD